MPKISNLDLGQAVNMNHPAAVTYHNQTTGVSTAVQPLPRSARNPDGKLLGLTFMTRNPTTGAPQ
ncbi:hypothetical protein PQQ51_33885, partial [Paraburkholderia xenovorans]|uniref:hypothetical protein n=1 Tax=Paraburkholderia xenovorans TaxID=36873 RepID=UPI0038B95F8B